MPPPNHQTGAEFSGVAMKNARSCAWSVRTDCAGGSPATRPSLPRGTLEFRALRVAEEACGCRARAKSSHRHVQ